MIATRITPALLLANDVEAATVSPTITTSSGTAILQLRKLALLIFSISSLSLLRLARSIRVPSGDSLGLGRPPQVCAPTFLLSQGLRCPSPAGRGAPGRGHDGAA